MPHDPFNSRWIPLPIQPRLDLLKAKQYAALIVWETLLCAALKNDTWQTSLSASAIRRETRLSHPTIRKAHQHLIAAGYIRVISGGGASRKTITFVLKPIPNFGKPATSSEKKGTASLPAGDFVL